MLPCYNIFYNMEVFMATGIYILRFKNTNKIYIGKSINISRRYTAHLRNLGLGLSSKKLQEAYNTYGEPTLDVLIECSEEELDKEEMEAISIFNSAADGFNTLDTIGGNNNQVGQNASNAKYSNDIYEQAFLLCAEGILPISEIASILDISPSVVASISSGQNHKWLKEKYPVEWEQLDFLRHQPNGYRSTAKYLNITYPELVHPNGTVIKVENLRECARKYDLDSGNLHTLLTGTLQTLKGFKVAGVVLKEYPTLVKNGVEYKIPYRGARTFAIEHDLSTGCLSSLLSGKKLQYKGWTVKNASS